MLCSVGSKLLWIMGMGTMIFLDIECGVKRHMSVAPMGTIKAPWTII
jgi:hypothetical protein